MKHKSVHYAIVGSGGANLVRGVVVETKALAKACRPSVVPRD